MPINSEHPDYKDNKDLWKKCNTFYRGADAVKKQGLEYLPKLNGQSIQSYNAYKERAVVPGYIPRTVSALVGAIFRKATYIELPEGLEYLRYNCDKMGSTLEQFLIRLVTEQLLTGRASVLTDRPAEGGSPYFCLYDADDLINWGDDSDPYYVIRSTKLVGSEDDKYDKKEVVVYYEYLLVDGVYTVRVWQKNERGELVVAEQMSPPLKNNSPVPYIPLIVATPTGLGNEVCKPPILELCEVAHSAYFVSADWMNALHVIGCPTPTISSDAILNQSQSDSGFTLNLGPDTALIMDSQGKAGFLESSRDLGALEKGMDRLHQLAAVLGARLLDSGGNSVMDTATSAMIKEGASTAVLSSVISSAELATKYALTMAADFEGIDPSGVEVKINRELVQSKIDANMLTSMFNAVIGGRMSFDTFYHNLEEGGLTKPGVDSNEEKKKILEDAELLRQINEDSQVNQVTGENEA